MFAILILCIIGICIGFDYLRDHLAERRERNRRLEKAALRRRFLARAPDSPAGFELLGDALRQADDPAEAIACYEEALALMAKAVPGTPTGTGWVAGSGIDTKLRLARLELAETVDPAQFGQTMRTRQQVCRTCGFLGMARDRDCRECGAPLPVDTLLDAWRHDAMRQSVVSESIQAVTILLVIGLTLWIASWMSLEVRGSLGIAAIIVIPIRLLKKLGGS